MGLNHSAQKVYALSQADLDAVNRSKVLPGLKQFFPEANPFNLIPNISVAGTNALPNTRAIGNFERRYPFDAKNPTWDITANLTKQRGSHNMKAGIFIERVLRPARRQSSFNGDSSFNANASNPFDTNFGFANALLGSINSYTESTSRPFAEGRFNQIEFFVQDNWRVSSRFTLDLGMRFVHNGPDVRRRPERRVLRPGPMGSGEGAETLRARLPGQRRRPAPAPLAWPAIRSPARSSTTPYIGKLVPGSGDFFNGMVVAEGTPPQYRNNSSIHRRGWASRGTSPATARPRCAAASASTTTATATTTSWQLVEQPPLMLTMQTNWTTLPQLLSSPLIQNPRPVSAFDEVSAADGVYAGASACSASCRGKFMADVAYVGNQNTNVARNIPINSLTPAQLVDPRNLDPTQNNGQLKDQNYLRQYYGYSTINVRRYFDEGVTYHSIQIAITRRLSNGLSFSAAYTGTRRAGLQGWDWFRTDEANRPGSRTRPAAGRTTCRDRLHLRDPGRGTIRRRRRHRARRAQRLADLRHHGDARRHPQRIRLRVHRRARRRPHAGTGRDPRRPRVRSQPAARRANGSRQFRTECVAPPGPLTDPNDTLYQGSALGDEWVSLGFINHDVVLFKNFAIGPEPLEIRMEAYNVFNTTQFQRWIRARCSTSPPVSRPIRTSAA